MTLDIRLGRLYRNDKGIWHFEIIRNGQTRYSSLHTRDKQKAEQKYADMKRAIERPNSSEYVR